MASTDRSSGESGEVPACIRDLLRPAAYPHAVDSVVLIQTHISYVLLAGGFAYKVKKSIDFGFVDYKTLERRHRMCEEEVRLNRRFCDGVYLGVVPIVRSPDGIHSIGSDGRGFGGETVEYAVKMRRVSDARTMPSLLAVGAIKQRELSALAEKLAAFHAAAGTNDEITMFGRPRVIRQNWEENLAQAYADVGRTVTRERADLIARFGDRFLGDHAQLFDERANTGHIRDGHGDLRSDAVVFHDDGSVCVMDCIEFNDRLRYADVASDVAFLAMDLEFRGYQLQADEFVSFYLEHALDATVTAVLPFYRVYRACVRGKVDGMQSGEREVPPAQRAAASDRAARYWELAEHMATALPAQTLVVMMGLSGSGKSYLARPLAARIGAVLLSSDVVRHRSRTDQDDRNPLYSKEARDVVYEKMFAEAERYLADGLSVVLDATFLARRHRVEAFQLATLANVPAIVVEVTAAADVVRARMSARDARSASDARWDTYLQQLDSIEPSGEVAADQLCQIDGAEPVDRGIDRALDAIASLSRRG